MSMTEKLSDVSWDNILKVIDCHLPHPFHQSKFNTLKNLNLDGIKEYGFCPLCEKTFVFKDKPKEFDCTCGNTIEKEVLKSNFQTFYNTPLKAQLIKMLNTPLVDRLRQECEESDVVNGDVYKNLKSINVIRLNDLSIQFFADGVAVVRRSKACVWPLIISLNELPYKLRRNNLFLCGIWFRHDVRVPMNVFLKPFIDELVQLASGFETTTFRSKEPIFIKVHMLLGIADSPARYKLQGFKQYNGEYGFPYCLHPGELIEPGQNNSRIYRGDVRTPRTVEQHERDLEIVKATGEITF